MTKRMCIQKNNYESLTSQKASKPIEKVLLDPCTTYEKMNYISYNQVYIVGQLVTHMLCFTRVIQQKTIFLA